MTRRIKGYMSYSALAEAIDTSGCRLLSTDVFDTVLLRDRTTESGRLATACRRAAPLIGVDAGALTRLRWSFHDSAYRAVAMERPAGDASLTAICRTIAAALGLDDRAAQVLRDVEVDVDIEHLRPHQQLLDLLDRAARAGVRVVAVSDIYYDGADVRRMIDTLAAGNPIAAVYTSADLGSTKREGHIFDEVAKRENVLPAEILHVGDNYVADVEMARAASWTAVHLPRDRQHHAERVIGATLALTLRMRRAM